MSFVADTTPTREVFWNISQGWVIYPLFAISIGIAVYGIFRRWKLKPKKLVYTNEAETILLALLAIMLTGFLVEGWRIAATHDPWGTWSPFGWLLARASLTVLNETALQRLHLVSWWTHAVL